MSCVVSLMLCVAALYILGQFPHNGHWGRGQGGSHHGHKRWLPRIKDEKQVTATLRDDGFLSGYDYELKHFV